MAIIVRVYTELKDVVTVVRLLKISTHEAGISPCCTRRTTVCKYSKDRLRVYCSGPVVSKQVGRDTSDTQYSGTLMHMEVLGDTSASWHAGRGQYQKCEIALPVLGSPAEPAGFIAALLITTICHKFRVIVRIYSRQRPG